MKKLTYPIPYSVFRAGFADGFGLGGVDEPGESEGGKEGDGGVDYQSHGTDTGDVAEDVGGSL